MMTEYKPRMSPERAAKLKEWQDNVYVGLKQQTTTTVVEKDGLKVDYYTFLLNRK
jgi:hypothetical protein